MKGLAEPHTLFLFEIGYNESKLPHWQSHATVRKRTGGSLVDLIKVFTLINNPRKFLFRQNKTRIRMQLVKKRWKVGTKGWKMVTKRWKMGTQRWKMGTKGAIGKSQGPEADLEGEQEADQG